jgi:hypothetical protein
MAFLYRQTRHIRGEAGSCIYIIFLISMYSCTPLLHVLSCTCFSNLATFLHLGRPLNNTFYPPNPLTHFSLNRQCHEIFYLRFFDQLRGLFRIHFEFLIKFDSKVEKKFANESSLFLFFLLLLNICTLMFKRLPQYHSYLCRSMRFSK